MLLNKLEIKLSLGWPPSGMCWYPEGWRGGFSTPQCEEAAPASSALPRLCIQGAAVRLLCVTAHTHKHGPVQSGNLEFHGLLVWLGNQIQILSFRDGPPHEMCPSSGCWREWGAGGIPHCLLYYKKHQKLQSGKKIGIGQVPKPETHYR